MRYDRRWRLSDRQRLSAIGAGVLSVFLSCMALGMGSIGLFLVAVLIVVATGTAVFLLGLRHAGNAYVSGKAHVIRASRAPVGVIVGRCEMQLLLELPGAVNRMVNVRDAATPVIKWPRAGMVLPVDVAPRSPRQLRVRWDQVLPHHARPAEEADEAAAFAGPFFTEFADRRSDDEIVAEPSALATLTVYDDDLDDLLSGDGENEPTPPTAITPVDPLLAEELALEPAAYPVEDLGLAPAADPVEELGLEPVSPPTEGPYDAAAEVAEAPAREPAFAPADGPVQAPAALASTEGPAPEPALAPTEGPPAEPAEDLYTADDLKALDEIIALEDLGHPGASDPEGSEGDGPVVSDALATVVEPAAPPAVLLDARAAQPISPVVDSPAVVPHPPADVAQAEAAQAEAAQAEAAQAEAAQAEAALAEPGSGEPVPGVGIMLIVSDLDRSLRFYRDNLGFTEVDTGVGTAVLAYGGGRILLRRVVDMSPVDRRVVHLHLEVPDVDAAYTELRRLGVEFVHKPRVSSRLERLELWAATFRDPDGHAIALTQWREREDLDAAVS